MRKILFLPLIAILPAFQGVPPEEPSRIVAVGENFAVVMAPPETVASAYVEDFQWTGDGTALLVKRVVVPDDAPVQSLLVARQVEGPAGVASLSHRTELVAWSPRKGKPRLLLAYDPRTTTLGELNHVEGDDRFYAYLSEAAIDPATGRTVTRHSYALLDAGSGTATRIPILDVRLFHELRFAPKGAVYLVQGDADHRHSIYPVAPNGALGRPAHLPKGADLDFDPRGAPLVSIMSKDARGVKTIQAYRFDLATGTMGAKVGPPAPVGYETIVVPTPTTGAPPVRAYVPPVPEMAAVMEGKRNVPGPIRLVLAPGQVENSALVTLDGTFPLLSRRAGAVAYLSGGSVLVRTFTRLSLDEYAKARSDTEREQTVERGRQVGLALAMYAADSDDALPPLGSDVREIVSPYVKSRSAFDGFVLEFGGDLPKEGLATFQIGYVSGPGGRVLVFADGSVRWQPDGS